MNEPIQVLDHGYVRHVESYGRGDANVPEAGIIEAARMSTQGAFRGWETDRKLLDYLFNARPQHATPFEFAGMIIEVQAPLFVFTEWDRHRTQIYRDIEGINQMSARYAPLPDMGYVPTVERILLNGETRNKQAGTVKGAQPITEEGALMFRQSLIGAYEQFEAEYQWALDHGVPKELARIWMPVGRYSRMRRVTSLRNWLGFLTLRDDPGAQWEIQQFAKAVGQLLAVEFPEVYSLFDRNRS